MMATLPIHVETRLVDFHIDREALDEAFAELAEGEGLDESEAGYVARRASRVATLLKNRRGSRQSAGTWSTTTGARWRRSG